MVKYYKLFVKDRGTPTISTLEYIDRNIREIHSLGVVISITKICEDKIDKKMERRLHSQGILRIPALVIARGRPIFGPNKIKQSLEELKYKARNQPVAENYTAYSDNEVLDNLFKNEMTFEAYKRDLKEESGMDSGFSSNKLDEEYKRKIQEQMGTRKIKGEEDFDMSRSSSSGGLNRMIQEARETAAEKRVEEPRNNLPKERKDFYTPGGGMSDEIFENKFMEMAGLSDY